MENKPIPMDEIETIGEIDLPKIDITPYIGKKAKIEQVEAFEGQYNGKTTYNVKISTEVLAVLGTGDKKVQLRASKILGMQKDSAGKLGWGKDTKLGAFMEKMKAKNLLDLAGKTVIIQTQTNIAKKRDYLTFN